MFPISPDIPPLTRRRLLRTAVLAGASAPFLTGTASVASAGASPARPTAAGSAPAVALAATCAGREVIVLDAGPLGQVLSLFTASNRGRYILTDRRALPPGFTALTVRTIDAAHRTIRVYGGDVHISYPSGRPPAATDEEVLARIVTHTPAVLDVSTAQRRIALVHTALSPREGLAVDGHEDATRILVTASASPGPALAYRIDADLRPSLDDPTLGSGLCVTTAAGTWQATYHDGSLDVEFRTPARAATLAWRGAGRAHSLAADDGTAVLVWTDTRGARRATALPTGQTRPAADNAVAVGGALAGVGSADGTAFNLVTLGD